MSRTYVSISWSRRKSGLLLFFVSIMAVLFLAAISSPAQSSDQTASRSPGWVVLPVEDYRTLHARAFPPDHPEVPDIYRKVIGDSDRILSEGSVIVGIRMGGSLAELLQIVFRDRMGVGAERREREPGFHGREGLRRPAGCAMPPGSPAARRWGSC